jgi:hypothetical protein
MMTKMETALKMPMLDTFTNFVTMKYTIGKEAAIWRIPERVTKKLVVQIHISKKTRERLIRASVRSDLTTSNISVSVIAYPVGLNSPSAGC